MYEQKILGGDAVTYSTTVFGVYTFEKENQSSLVQYSREVVLHRAF